MATGLDYVVIMGYFLAMVVLGLVGMRRARTAEDYVVAGRRLPTWLYMPCLAAVILGGGGTMGTAKLGYQFGISGVWLVTMYGIGVIILGFLLSSKLSSLRVVTLSEVLYLRYGAGARTISAVIMWVYLLMIAVLQIIGMGTIISTLFNWNLTSAILVSGVIVIFYTLLGGMWSVSLTDFGQFLVMTVGIFFIAVPVGLGKVGGLAGVLSAGDASRASLGAIGLHSIVSYFFLFVLGMMIGQDLWQRVFTAKDARTARVGTVATGLYCIAYAVAVTLVGMIAFAANPNLSDAQNAFAYVAVNVLPPGLTGLLVAAGLSALMSTASGPILAAATVAVNDIYEPVVRRGAASGDSLGLTRILVLGIGVLALVISLYLQDLMVALDVAYDLLSGCIFIPTFAAFFWRRGTWQGAVGSMLLSAVAVVVGIVMQGPSSPTPIMYGLATSAVTFVAISYLTPAPSEEEIGRLEKQVVAASSPTAEAGSDSD